MTSSDQKQTDLRRRWVQASSQALHVVAGLYFAYVLAWHFISPTAQQLPLYYNFGWFYCALTFWTFNVQTLQLNMALIADLFPHKVSTRWKSTVGSLGCLVLCGASTVTTMYYAIRWIDSRALDPPETRVPWVNQTVHVLNSIVAWIDIHLSHPRPFASSDRVLVVFYTLCYSSWLLFLKCVTDEFPYPFLNKMPPFLGWLGICSVGSAFMLSFFEAAKLSRRLLRSVLEQTSHQD